VWCLCGWEVGLDPTVGRGDCGGGVAVWPWHGAGWGVGRGGVGSVLVEWMGGFALMVRGGAVGWGCRPCGVQRVGQGWGLASWGELLGV